MKREFSEKDLWDLRNQVTLNSLFTSDYENRLGLDPNAVQDFFDGYLEELDYIAEQDGEKNLDLEELLDRYDNPENLKNWYDSLDYDPFGDEEPSDEELDDIDADFEENDFMPYMYEESLENAYAKLDQDAREAECCPEEPVAKIVPEELEGTFKTLGEAKLGADDAIGEVKKILKDYQSMLDEDGDKGDDMYAAGMQAMIDAISEAVGGLGEFYQEAKRIMAGRLTEATGTEDVDRLYDIIDVLGYEEVLDALIKWLPNDDIAEFADDITRDYDLDYDEDEEEEEDEDVFDDSELDDDSEYWDKAKASSDYFGESKKNFK